MKTLRFCKICKQYFDVNESIRVYGEHVSDNGCCSAKCYSKMIFETSLSELQEKPTEYILIFENGDPIKLVSSMKKFHEYKDDHPDKHITWLSFELE